ncbi:secreted trypsin-like serine protease [Actinoalloteichus hoggarensis]|uniref:Putative peptidase n=1 Tax=Actinoalloteichus hoggarensis TaxID=1470176 RepID=A0A221VYT4_9PSEU|nr:trypsin-like serine protease [Actinoalloteichus hoggarensis]ASO18703.1 putative peptidase precursor [Actinoalloteichus hoggarensis]MBB5919936.1 secreted trypsin-like serine protease [Actinoalloteichus hoggarensis]
MRLNRLVPTMVGAATAVLSVIGLSTSTIAAEPATADSPAPVVAPVSAVAAPETDDAQTFIIDGEFATDAPWAARMFSSGSPVCSATIIAPEWILTATHCVSSPSATTFRVGSLDANGGGTVVGVTETVAHPVADITLARIDQAVDATYAPLGSVGDVRVDDTVQLYGWGATCTGNESGCQSQFLKYADTRVHTLDGQDWLGGDAVGVTRINGIAAGGDSGGPMFATSPVDGGYYQVGVASTSDRATVSFYTDITRYRDWISSVAGV